MKKIIIDMFNEFDPIFKAVLLLIVMGMTYGIIMALISKIPSSCQ